MWTAPAISDDIGAWYDALWCAAQERNALGFPFPNTPPARPHTLGAAEWRFIQDLTADWIPSPNPPGYVGFTYHTGYNPAVWNVAQPYQGRFVDESWLTGIEGHNVNLGLSWSSGVYPPILAMKFLSFADTRTNGGLATVKYFGFGNAFTPLGSEVVEARNGGFRRQRPREISSRTQLNDNNGNPAVNGQRAERYIIGMGAWRPSFVGGTSPATDPPAGASTYHTGIVYKFDGASNTWIYEPGQQDPPDLLDSINAPPNHIPYGHALEGDWFGFHIIDELYKILDQLNVPYFFSPMDLSTCSTGTLGKTATTDPGQTTYAAAKANVTAKYAAAATICEPFSPSLANVDIVDYDTHPTGGGYAVGDIAYDYTITVSKQLHLQLLTGLSTYAKRATLVISADVNPTPSASYAALGDDIGTAQTFHLPTGYSVIDSGGSTTMPYPPNLNIPVLPATITDPGDDGILELNPNYQSLIEVWLLRLNTVGGSPWHSFYLP